MEPEFPWLKFSHNKCYRLDIEPSNNLEPVEQIGGWVGDLYHAIAVSCPGQTKINKVSP